MVMEILLLFALAGGLAWIWNRMEAIERRVAELEGAAHVSHAWPALHEPLSYAPDLVTSRNEPEPEFEEQEPEVTPPIAADVVPEEEVFETKESFLERGYRFRPSFDFE